jgi:hypothetical protein
MSNFFILLLLASVAFFIIGFFNPKTSLFWDKKERTKKKSAFVYGGFIVLSFILFGVSSDSKEAPKSNEKVSAAEKTDLPSKPREEEKASNIPTEQKLVVLDANTFVDASDIKVIRMKSLLDDLALKYAQSRDTIAEYTSRAQGVLHDKGVQESCLNILEEMNRADKIKNTPYSDAIILYLMVREKQ